MHIRHATCHERHGRARTPRVCGAHVVRGGQTGVRTMRSLRVTCAGLALIAVCSVGAAGLTGCSPAQAGGTARGQVSAVASSSSADSASDEAAQSGEATRDEVVAESVQASPEIASAADAPVADDALQLQCRMRLPRTRMTGPSRLRARWLRPRRTLCPRRTVGRPIPSGCRGRAMTHGRGRGLSTSAASPPVARGPLRHRNGSIATERTTQAGTGKFGSVPVTVVISGGRITSIEGRPQRGEQRHGGAGPVPGDTRHHRGAVG